MTFMVPRLSFIPRPCRPAAGPGRAFEPQDLDVDGVLQKGIDGTTIVSAVDDVVRRGPTRTRLVSQPRSWNLKRSIRICCTEMLRATP